MYVPLYFIIATSAEILLGTFSFWEQKGHPFAKLAKFK